MNAFNMLDYAEMYRNDRMREAENARIQAEALAAKPVRVRVVVGEALTVLGGALTALGTYLASNRSV